MFYEGKSEIEFIWEEILFCGAVDMYPGEKKEASVYWGRAPPYLSFKLRGKKDTWSNFRTGPTSSSHDVTRSTRSTNELIVRLGP
ncbi:hypothetical protein TNIN_372591 [Trichonephila inaurata madagascariensis]|uniref:Uncharacterized protein n=1 Tax=Trichonephila inaurata madagascariensis TaxID=2747483 RepID=A0A8X6YIA5_9ARAC|nr:hypothetical protein TNIN_372591 [Trichonephila inaurata madagascariensis]